MFYSSLEARDVLRDLLSMIDEEEVEPYQERDAIDFLHSVINGPEEGGD